VLQDPFRPDRALFIIGNWAANFGPMLAQARGLIASTGHLV